MPLANEIARATEASLIEQASGGSNDALAALFQMYSAQVHRVAYRLTLSAVPNDRSFMWVSTANHFVVRSQTVHRFDDTEFDDRVELQRFVPAI